MKRSYKFFAAIAVFSVVSSAANAQVVKTENIGQEFSFLEDLGCHRQTYATFADGNHGMVGYNCFVNGVEVVMGAQLESKRKIPRSSMAAISVQQLTAYSTDKAKMINFVRKLQQTGWVEVSNPDEIVTRIENGSVRHAKESAYMKDYHFYSMSYLPSDNMGPGRFRVGVFVGMSAQPCMYAENVACEDKSK